MRTARREGGAGRKWARDCVLFAVSRGEGGTSGAQRFRHQRCAGAHGEPRARHERGPEGFGPGRRRRPIAGRRGRGG